MAHITVTRDSDRADDLQEIANLWRTYFPNERFGQFLCNCIPSAWNTGWANEDFGRFIWETPLDCILVAAKIRVKKITEPAEEGLKKIIEESKAIGLHERTIGFVDGQLVKVDLSDIYEELAALRRALQDQSSK